MVGRLKNARLATLPSRKFMALLVWEFVSELIEFVAEWRATIQSFGGHAPASTGAARRYRFEASGMGGPLVVESLTLASLDKFINDAIPAVGDLQEPIAKVISLRIRLKSNALYLMHRSPSRRWPGPVPVHRLPRRHCCVNAGPSTSEFVL